MIKCCLVLIVFSLHSHLIVSSEYVAVRQEMLMLTNCSADDLT